MTPINRFLLDHQLRIASNPCVSPDFCLDWPGLLTALRAGAVTRYPSSRVQTSDGAWELAEDAHGDHAWLLTPQGAAVPPAAAVPPGGEPVGAQIAYAATWEFLLWFKNRVQEHDADSTVFPSAAPALCQRSLGVGARFTTLHWPAVEWVMAQLGLPLVANQNSIPRELVYDVDAMLAGRLDRVPFPFIGGDVPEGHQGQSVEGMSHGAVLSKLKTGFHRRRIPWGFNADHQPVGGRFDAREERLVAGCCLASSITFDPSPELLAGTRVDPPSAIAAAVGARVRALGHHADPDLLRTLWPAMEKLQRRARLYGEERARRFTTAVGRAYVRELSIDELPGLTTPATLATVLALAEALAVQIHYVAPAFGFQKNLPFTDGSELERRVRAAWAVCQAFGVSLGFHSGSGKSAENYRLCGAITGSRLEIKTSGRYTYEMGRALAASSDAADQRLWRDWWMFTRDLALDLAFGDNATARDLARQFLASALGQSPFADRASCAAALAQLTPDPEHPFWFEYNFLFVLAADGRAVTTALGDHGPAGYRQRARFYAVSDQARLGYLRRVAEYLLFLAETTGLAAPAACVAAQARLQTYRDAAALIAEIGTT
jgi:hypothetical protein